MFYNIIAPIQVQNALRKDIVVMKIKVYFYNVRKGENRSIVFDIKDYNDIDKYIDNWIDEQIKSKLSDDFFDDCFKSDINYSWFTS